MHACMRPPCPRTVVHMRTCVRSAPGARPPPMPRCRTALQNTRGLAPHLPAPRPVLPCPVRHSRALTHGWVLGHRADRLLVVRQDGAGLLHAQVPQPDGAVVAAADDLRVRGVRQQAAHRLLVPRQHHRLHARHRHRRRAACIDIDRMAPCVRACMHAPSPHAASYISRA